MKATRLWLRRTFRDIAITFNGLRQYRATNNVQRQVFRNTIRQLKAELDAIENEICGV